MAQSCVRCERDASFELGGTMLCTRHTFTYAPMLRRSLLTALVVGTILVGINQGNVLADGRFPAALWWKIPLTFTVPFCVATWGALVNSRVR
jgi:hypothetical protein